MKQQEKYIVSIDVGGTFTDVVALRMSDGEEIIAKVPSTPGDPSEGFINGLKYLITKKGVRVECISHIIHGSTVGCNAVVEGNLPKTVLLTTKGFRDNLELARMIRGKIYDLSFSKPRLLVPRRMRYEVCERLNYKGEVIQELTQSEIDNAIDFVKNSGAEAVAICFLYSYMNPEHEERLRRALEEAVPNVYISASSEVNPTFREYERTCVTVLNAALRKTMASYLSRIDQGLRSLNCSANLYIMRQDGGVMGNLTAQEIPIHALISGPTGGALMAASLSRQMNSNAISLDVGGTTADACLIKNGEIQFADNWEIGGYPLTIRSIEVNPIGAGGGSIAWVDDSGFLRVGPQSAGANPGPIAYKKGGDRVTLTDANITLGRLASDSLLNGAMDMDTQAATEAVEAFGKEIGMELHNAAEGIIRVAVANMAKGIRKISAERGLDLRDFVLVPFGGGGPMYGSELARELGIPKVLIPRHPGTASALGLSSSDLKHVTQRSCVQEVAEVDLEAFQQLVGELQENILKVMRKEGHTKEEIQFSAAVDMRYVGQSYDLPVDLSMDVNQKSMDEAVSRFHSQYKTYYGHCSPEKPVELVNLHLSGTVSLNAAKTAKQAPGHGSEAAKCASRKVVFHGKVMDTTVYRRELLGVGDCISGPAIITEYDSTTIVWPEDFLQVDDFGNLIITWETNN